MILNAATFILTNLKMIKLTKEKKSLRKLGFCKRFYYYREMTLIGTKCDCISISRNFEQ